MGRKCKEIRAVLYIPETESAKIRFEKKICDFYAGQVEKKIYSYPLTKRRKLEILKLLEAEYSEKSKRE